MALIETPRNKVLDDQIRTAIALTAQQLSTKVRLQTFDPDAIDGDGDGFVQDGTPFMRPAVVSAIANASQRLGKILSRAGTLNKSGRAREYQRRYAGMSASDIAKDAVPDSLEAWAALAYERMRIQYPDMPPLSPDMTPFERDNAIRALEDYVEDDLKWMLSPEKAKEFDALKRTDRAAAFKMLLEGAFDFSPEAVAKNRELVEHALTTNPEFRALVDKFGLPSIVKFGPNMDSSHMASGVFNDSMGIALKRIRNPRSKGRLDRISRGLGKWFMTGIMEPDIQSKKTKRWTTSEAPEALLIHEYGHYLVEAVKQQLSGDDEYHKSKRWQAWRFAAGAYWKDTLRDIGHEEWWDEIKREGKEGRDIPDYVPHVATAYGESAPAEAFAEAIAATIALDGRDSDLVNPAMKELINTLLELPEGKEPRENLAPKRANRVIVPDGLASRGSVMAINAERDERFGEISDPYELTAELLGDLGEDDPVGKMMRTLRDLRDDPERWDRLNEKMKKEITESLKLRRATEKEAALLASVLINDPAFAEMIRRHGMPNYYFAEENLYSPTTGIDIRGVLYAGFTPDDSTEGKFWPPRIVIDTVGTTSLAADDTLDVPREPAGDDWFRRATRVMNVPGGVTRQAAGNSHQHVIRHEGAHGIHDQLWERVYRGEIKGRRAQLIRAYGTTTWEEFYAELGRPDLLAEYKRAISVNPGYPGATKPSDEIAFIDSAYAWSNPREFFAEAAASYMSSNPDYHALMNDAALEHMQAILGDSDSVVPDAPPRMRTDTPSDLPEPPPWDGFASRGKKKIKSYRDLRKQRLDEANPDAMYNRREVFRNTTTAQKVDLAVPTNEDDYLLMVLDQVLDSMNPQGDRDPYAFKLTFRDISLIDLSDPDNPKMPMHMEQFRYFLAEVVKQARRNMPDFSPDRVRTNREALTATLDTFPRMREAAERFGLPVLGTMTDADLERRVIDWSLDEDFRKFRRGNLQDIRPEILAVLPKFREYREGLIEWEEMLADPSAKEFVALLKRDAKRIAELKGKLGGGYNLSIQSIHVPAHVSEAFAGGKRYDPAFVPEAGGWLISDTSLESILLHEFSHYIDAKRTIGFSKETDRLKAERKRLFANVTDHIKTRYGQSNEQEFTAEAIMAILTGNRDSEELLSKPAREWARRMAGLPEKDPVFTGKTRIPRTDEVVLTDRFNSVWTKTPDGQWVNASGERRNRPGVPDVLESFAEARERSGLVPMEDVSFDHEGRRFTMRDNGTVFEVDINGRTVATATVVEGENGLPEIRSVDVLPGYEGIAPDEDLYEMVVDHARKKYPSARAPRRARKTDISTEGFASVGPEHHDARGIVGTPGTPEYAQAVASEFEAARASGKRVFFDYNNETREVQVTEVFEKNGFLYMKGNDALRNGEERVFRLDRVSMPKRVENPQTKAAEVAKKPGKKPRKPVPVFTGKAKDIFEGAESWEEVAERLGKGRYVFFDFETTGIEENPDGIDYLHPGTPTQIGLVEIIDGKVTRRWSTHVNPGRPLSVDPATGRSWSADNLKYRDPDTGQLVNISDEWLATQKPLKEALEEMLEFIGPIEDTILGGQNHPYDNDVMRRAMIDAGLDESRWKPGGFIDSQALAQALLDIDSDDYPRDPQKGYKTVSLGPLAEFLGYDMGDGWHSADKDSEASWEAFSRLIKRAADHENSGKPVRRDLLDTDGGEKEHAKRMERYEGERSAWEDKARAYREAKAAETPGDVPKQSTDGFASRGSTRSAPRRRAKNPAHWENMTQEQRDAATKESAEAAVEYLDALADVGIDVNTLRDLDRAELDAILRDLIPGGEARVSDYVTGDGKALIEVSNATMGKAFMAMGFHVQVNSDDPNEHHILENGIDDMQKALQDYVKAIAKDPESLRKDRVFRDWASKNGIDVDGLSDKKLEKAAKAFAEKFEINMCLYYKSGTNMLCGANIGIRREEMPQISGRMKGDDTLAAKAIKAGLMKAKEFAIDDEKLKSLDPAKQDELRKLAKDPARVMELARSKDPLAKELFDVLNWNNTEANAEEMIDRAAGALGIAVDVPRFVDPETMLGAQNELQGSKVEKMADAAVKAVLEAVPVLEARLGRKPTNREISEYLANEVKHGLFQPTLTAGLPGGQIYMLDGHHRWAGLLMANRKLEAMGFDVRAELNIKNYQTDIRSGLELGRAIQVAMGIKDAKLAGEDIYKIDPDIPDLTPEEFDKAVAELLDKKNLIDRVRKVREGGKFRETEAFDEPGQRGRLSPRRRPVKERVDEVIRSQVTIRPQSRVKGKKARSVGYRAAESGSGWQSVEDHIALETERGNELFETHKEYLGKGYETAWVTHTPDDAGRYVVAAGDVPAWEAGEIEVKPEDIAELDLSNATLVGTDDEGGFLYVRKKPTRRTRERIRELKAEEEFLDEFASPGGDEGFASRGRTGPELASAGKQSQVQRIIDGGWTASADDLRDARRLIDEIEGTIGKKKADALRKKLDELEKERRELVDSLGIGKPPPFPVYRTGDTGDARRRPELSGLTDGGFGVRTGDPEKDRQIQEEMNARRRQQDEMLKVLEQVLEQTRQTFDDWSNGFGADDEGARAADNWSTKKKQNMDRKAWSNIDPETGKPTIGTPIYEETIRMGPSGLRGRATYKFKADDEGFVAVYKKGSTKPIATLMVDREFTHEGGLRKPRSDRHHIENIFVDEAHRRRGIATEMARIAEHVYGGRVEHSSMLTTLGKKFRDADVERRGTPANPSPFEDEFGNRIVPVGEVGFASRGEERGERPFSFNLGTPTPTEGESRPAERPDTGNYVPMPPDEDDFGEPSALDRLADKLGLDKQNEPDTQMSALTAQIMGRIAGGEASLAERLGITPQQLAERFREIGDEINRFVDRFVNDRDVRAKVKLGYKLLKAAAIVFGMKGMKDFLMMVNPDFSFGGTDDGSLNLLNIVDSILGAGIHQALTAFGLNFANLIASEYAAMRLVTRRKAKRMIEEIRERIEGSGQYIGTMSREMWDRLRGAWAKTRARAPIPVPAGAKQWIVAGSSPIWAELSWSDYQTKSRITQKLAPTDRAAWQRIATKVGQSPELIDIASYRAGLGYGHRRVKSRDVVRVYL